MRVSVRAKKIEFPHNTYTHTRAHNNNLAFSSIHCATHACPLHIQTHPRTWCQIKWICTSGTYVAQQLFYQIFVSAHHRLLRLSFVYIFCMRLSVLCTITTAASIRCRRRRRLAPEVYYFILLSFSQFVCLSIFFWESEVFSIPAAHIAQSMHRMCSG